MRKQVLDSPPSTSHQALQTLKTFEVPNKPPFADCLPALRSCLSPNDSTMQVTVKGLLINVIDDQFRDFYFEFYREKQATQEFRFVLRWCQGRGSHLL